MMGFMGEGEQYLLTLSRLVWVTMEEATVKNIMLLLKDKLREQKQEKEKKKEDTDNVICKFMFKACQPEVAEADCAGLVYTQETGGTDGTGGTDTQAPRHFVYEDQRLAFEVIPKMQ